MSVVEKNPEFFNYQLDVILSLEKGFYRLSSSKILDCFFIEDIFSYNIFGKMIFRDDEGIFEIGPFTGNEAIMIAYSIGDGKEVKLPFNIWKVSEISQQSDVDASAGSLIEIEFVDISFNVLFLRKFSRSWPVKTLYSDVAYYILDKVGLLKDIGVDIVVEESLNKIEREPLAFPYWTVMDSIKYLSKRIVSKEMKTSGYLCYTSIVEEKRTMNYRSMNWLLSDKNKKDEDEYMFYNEDRNYKNRIYEYSINGTDNICHRVIRGGKWLGYDFDTKSFLTYDSLYKDELKETTVLGKYSLFHDIDSEEVTNKLIGERSQNALKYYANAEWQYRYNKQNLVSITVLGNQEREVGTQIKISKWVNYDHDDTGNSLLKGKFLIKTIKHILARRSQPSYSQQLVLIKNGYEDVQSKMLVKSTKRNLIT
jgi:hypothetical protein